MAMAFTVYRVCSLGILGLRLMQYWQQVQDCLWSFRGLQRFIQKFITGRRKVFVKLFLKKKKKKSLIYLRKIALWEVGQRPREKPQADSPLNAKPGRDSTPGLMWGLMRLGKGFNPMSLILLPELKSRVSHLIDWAMQMPWTFGAPSILDGSS